MWNMAKGKCSYHTKLAAPADGVAFAPASAEGASPSEGSVYALLAGTVVSLHSAEGDGTMLHALHHERRVLCMAFGGQHTVLTGAATLLLAMYMLFSLCPHDEIEQPVTPSLFLFMLCCAAPDVSQCCPSTVMPAH